MKTERRNPGVVVSRTCAAMAIVWMILVVCLPANGQRVVPFGPSAPVPPPNCFPYGSGSAIHYMCVPQPWNGSVILYAHGYVSPAELPAPILPPEKDQVEALVEPLGFAFATTSYPDLGMVVPEAVTDLASLVGEFKGQYPQTRNVYLVGFSEGGLIAAKSIEQRPDLYSGGLACCGPIGDFRKEINYFGDFFVVFNYFFPGVLPAGTNPGNVPDSVVENWDTTYVQAVTDALAAEPGKLKQLLRVTNAAVDPADPASQIKTVLSVLWYDIFATNDILLKFGGQPFDNSLRWYSGSTNDWALNRGVQRFHADAAALQYLQANYQTTGLLRRPLVTMHTTYDPVVPYWHETLYTLKTLLSGSLLKHINIPIVRYGHCNFETPELLTAFGLLVQWVEGQ